MVPPLTSTGIVRYQGVRSRRRAGRGARRAPAAGAAEVRPPPGAVMSARSEGQSAGGERHGSPPVGARARSGRGRGGAGRCGCGAPVTRWWLTIRPHVVAGPRGVLFDERDDVGRMGAAWAGVWAPGRAPGWAGAGAASSIAGSIGWAAWVGAWAAARACRWATIRRQLGGHQNVTAPDAWRTSEPGEVPPPLLIRLRSRVSVPGVFAGPVNPRLADGAVGEEGDLLHSVRLGGRAARLGEQVVGDRVVPEPRPGRFHCRADPEPNTIPFSPDVSRNSQ